MGERHLSSFLFQTIGTTVFVFTMIIAGMEATRISEKFVLNVTLMILSLIAMIAASKNIGGACFNPFVGLALQIWAHWTVYDVEILAAVDDYAYIFYVAAALGGVLSGLLAIVHDQNMTIIKKEAKRIEDARKPKQIEMTSQPPTFSDAAKQYGTPSARNLIDHLATEDKPGIAASPSAKTGVQDTPDRKSVV